MKKQTKFIQLENGKLLGLADNSRAKGITFTDFIFWMGISLVILAACITRFGI